MTTTYILLIVFSVLCIMLSATSKALCDTIQFKFSFSKLKNLGSWWNPRKSWELKYKDYMKLTKNHWWYFGLYKPNYDERFPFSTTLLVSVTDAWHLFEMVHNISDLLSGVLLGLVLSYLISISCLYLLLVIVVYVVFISTFHVVYHNILN